MKRSKLEGGHCVVKVQKISKPLFRLAGFLTLALVLSSCTFKSKTQLRSIRIALPQAGKSAAAKTGGVLKPRGGGSSAPASLSDVACYAVNITGDAVPPNPNVHCGANSDQVGIMGGFVSALSAAPVVQVDNVPPGSIKVQLIAVSSTVGCPNFDQMIANPSSNVFDGISEPILVASGSATVEGDTTINLMPTFGAASRAMFQGCGIGDEGPQIAPTYGYQGYFTESAATGPIDTLTSVPAPSTTTPPGPALPAEFTSTAISAAVMAGLPLHDSGSTPPLTSGISTVTSSTLQRAVMQFQFDVTAQDLVTYPYGRFEIQMRGGQDDSCLFTTLFGATAAAWDSTAANWLALNGSNNYGSAPSWSWGGGGVNVPLSQLKVHHVADNKDYVIVNVESNFVSTALCNSAVYVSSASLMLAKTFAGTGGHQVNQVQLRALAPQTGSSGMTATYPAPYSGTVRLYAQGGTPPYTYSMFSGTGTVGAVTGIYTAPASGASDVVQVADSSSPQQTAQTQLNLSSAASGVIMLGAFATGITNSPVGGEYVAGTCFTFDIRTIGFNGASPHVGGLQTINLPSSGSTSSWYGTTDCSSVTINQATIQSATSQTTVSYKAEAVGSNNLNSGNMVAPSFDVYAAPLSSITIVGPQHVTSGVCVPMSFKTADAFGNVVAPGATEVAAITNLPAGSAGFFSDTACSTSVPSPFSFATGAATLSGSFKAVTPGTFSAASSSCASSTPTSLSCTFPTLTVVNTNLPVTLKLAFHGSAIPDVNNCIQVDATPVDSAGGAFAPGGTTSIQPPTYMPGGAVYSTASDCQHFSNGTNVSISPSSTGVSFWVSAYPGATIQTGAGQNDNVSIDPSNILTVQ